MYPRKLHRAFYTYLLYLSDGANRKFRDYEVARCEKHQAIYSWFNADRIEHREHSIGEYIEYVAETTGLKYKGMAIRLYHVIKNEDRPAKLK